MQEVFFNNAESTAKAMGLAIDSGNRQAYYISMAAAGTANESIWASLVSAGKRRAVTARGWHASPFGMDTPTTRVTKPLPNTVEQHYLVRSLNKGLVLIDDPSAALLDSWDRRERIKTYRELICYLMTEAINAVTTVSWAPEWTPILLDNPPYNAWTKLDCYGDALVGYVINPSFEWIGHVKDNWNYRYAIPPQPLVEKVAALTAA
jgi:hypothetical protein